MTHCQTRSHMPSHRPARPWTLESTWLTGAWRRLLTHCLRALRYRRDVNALRELDDRQLKDIGLRRGDIESFVAHSAFRLDAYQDNDIRRSAIDRRP